MFKAEVEIYGEVVEIEVFYKYYEASPGDGIETAPEAAEVDIEAVFDPHGTEVGYLLTEKQLTIIEAKIFKSIRDARDY